MTRAPARFASLIEYEIDLSWIAGPNPDRRRPSDHLRRGHGWLLTGSAGSCLIGHERATKFVELRCEEGHLATRAHPLPRGVNYLSNCKRPRAVAAHPGEWPIGVMTAHPLRLQDLKSDPGPALVQEPPSLMSGASTVIRANPAAR